jgi:hypothetical protein
LLSNPSSSDEYDSSSSSNKTLKSLTIGWKSRNILSLLSWHHGILLCFYLIFISFVLI